MLKGGALPVQSRHLIRGGPRGGHPCWASPPLRRASRHPHGFARRLDAWALGRRRARADDLVTTPSTKSCAEVAWSRTQQSSSRTCDQHSNRVYKSKRESARPGEENPLHQTNPRRDRAKRYEDPEPEECTEAAETTTGRQTDGQARNAAKAAPGET